MFSKEELEKIFVGFNGLKVLIIGDVMIDSYIWGHVKRLSPEAPVPIVNVVKRENRLGGAANVAINIQSLGAVPIICSVIGDDEKGDTFCKIIAEKNMPSHGIIKSKERLTTVKFRVIGNNSHLLRVDEETESVLTDNETALLFFQIKKIINTEKIDVIIFEDYDKGVISKTLIDSTIEVAKKNNVPVVVDPKKNNFSHYTQIQLFKPNFRELCDGLKADLNLSEVESFTSALTDFQKKQNIATVLLSLSEHGVLISEMLGNKFNIIKIPAHLRTIADVSGAGDTLISVAALCIALKLSAGKTAALSNLAGGVVCEHVGVIPIDKEKFFNEAVKLLL